MNRDDLINFIPKPSNQDVIIYDISLKDLIDTDVFEEYQLLLPIFKSKVQEYLNCKRSIEEYEKEINKIYLFKTNWSEDDYLFQLQNEKRTYSTLFGPIKKVESNITMLQKKIKNINEKIQMQTVREDKQIEERKEKLEKTINENIEKIIVLKENIATLKIEAEKLQQLVQENQEEFNTIQQIVDEINSGNCKCKYCGSILRNVSENSRFFQRTKNNLEENKTELEKLLEKQSKNKEKLDSYTEQYKEAMSKLRNDTNFKKENNNTYHKKSVEILRLEGERDALLKNVTSLQKELENNSKTKEEQFLKIKDKITKYELSLENLQKIKEMQSSIENEKNQFSTLKKEIIEMKAKMEKYKTFLTFFFKIYEQKATDFCGKDFKFKIFDFDEQYNLTEKFEIYYKSVKFENLTPSVQSLVNAVLQQKFVFYN